MRKETDGHQTLEQLIAANTSALSALTIAINKGNGRTPTGKAMPHDCADKPQDRPETPKPKAEPKPKPKPKAKAKANAKTTEAPPVNKVKDDGTMSRANMVARLVQLDGLSPPGLAQKLMEKVGGATTIAKLPKAGAAKLFPALEHFIKKGGITEDSLNSIDE